MHTVSRTALSFRAVLHAAKNKTRVVFYSFKGRKKQQFLMGSCVPRYQSDGVSLGGSANGSREERMGTASQCKHADKGEPLGV